MSVKRAWREKTVSLRKPKKQTQRPRENLKEKVGYFLSLGAVVFL